MAAATTALKTLAQALGTPLVNPRAADAYIILLNREDDRPSGQILRFQYFPGSIADVKTVNWQEKNFPGASLPIYQWVNSGARTIAFAAQFTSDVDLANYVSARGAYQNLKLNGLESRNVDIRTAILWLRQFQLPTYLNGADGQVTAPPPKMILGLENSGIGISGGVSAGSTNTADQIYAILMSMDVTYDAFFPSGLPRAATVNLTFAQIAQVGHTISFPDNSEFSGAFGSVKTVFGDIIEAGSDDGRQAAYTAPRRNRKPENR